MNIRENAVLTSEGDEPVVIDAFLEMNGLSNQVNSELSNVIDHEDLYFVRNFMLLLSSLMTLLEPKTLRLLFPLLMVIFLNGCMYSPKYEDYYQESETEISYQEQHQRKQRIYQLLSTENLPKSTTAIISTGINPCQKKRIMRNFEALIKDISPEGFDEYLTLCEKAKELCGIMNPDRYSPTLLSELVNNYESREYNAGLRQVLVLTSRKDIEKTPLNIQALSVDSHRLEELIKLQGKYKYKVILIETASTKELTHQLNILQRNGIFEDGLMKGVLVIGHGDQDEVENGLEMTNVSLLSRLNRHLIPDKSFFVYFSCLSAEGEHEENNMVNSTAIVLPRTSVYGCPTVVEDMDFEIDPRGELIPGSLELSTFFALGNDTFVPNRENAVTRQAQRIKKSMAKKNQCTSDLAFFQKLVNLGITDENAISDICIKGIPAETYSALSAAGWERYEFLIHRPPFDMSYARAIEYADAGIRGRQGMLKLHKANISPMEIRMLRSVTRAKSLTENITHPDALVAFKKENIGTHELLPYLYNGIYDLPTIIQKVTEQRAIARNSEKLGSKLAKR